MNRQLERGQYEYTTNVGVDLSMIVKSWTVGHSPYVPQEVHEAGVKVGGLSLFFSMTAEHEV